VRLNILTRKTLGGLQTDLESRVLGQDGAPVPGLYAAGEVAGFGGGGVHGYSALEGTFSGERGEVRAYFPPLLRRHP
jgi:predicted oxidoreductase